MKKVVLMSLMFMTMNVQATVQSHMYSKVDEILAVSEWLEASERGVSTIKLEKDIETNTNRMLSIVKQIAKPEGMIVEDHVAYMLARTPKFLSLMTVEHNQKYIYFGAASDMQYVSGPVSYDDHVSRVTSLQQNFYEVLTVMEGINLKLGQAHGIAPLKMKEDLDGRNALTVGRYSLVRMDLNDDLPEDLVEDFLLTVWTMVEQGLPYPEVNVLNQNSCGYYLKGRD